jgi:hypothetical protein
MCVGEMYGDIRQVCEYHFEYINIRVMVEHFWDLT